MKVVSPHENAPPDGEGLRFPAPDGERILAVRGGDRLALALEWVTLRLVGEGSLEMGRDCDCDLPGCGGGWTR